MFQAKSNLLLPFLAALITALTLTLYLSHSFNLHHDGHMYFPTLAITLEGKTLFRQVATIYGYLTFLTNTLILKLTGFKLIHLKIFSLATYSLTSGILTYLWSRFLPQSLTLSALFLWLAASPFHSHDFLIWPSVYALLTQSLTLLAIYRFTQTQNARFILLAGIFSGLTLSYRINVGSALFLGGLTLIATYPAALKLPRPRFFQLLAQFLTGNLLVLLPQLLWLALNGTLIDWWQQSIIWPLEFSRFYSTHPSLAEPLHHLLLTHTWKPSAFTPTSLLFWRLLPANNLLILATTAISLFFTRRHLPLFSYSLLSLTSWIQYFPISEPRHLFWASTPMFGLLFITIAKSLSLLRHVTQAFSPHPTPPTSSNQLILITTTAFLLFQLNTGVNRTIHNSTPLTQPAFLQDLYTDREEAQLIHQTTQILNRFFAENPNQTYINYTHQPFFSSLHPNHFNPHPMYFRWEFITNRLTPEHFQTVMNYVHTHSPAIISDIQLNLTGYRIALENQPFSLYLYLPPKNPPSPNIPHF